MLTRRNIRIKVMQTLYAITDIDVKPNEPQRILKQQFQNTQSLLVFCLQFLTDLAKYAEKDAYLKASKYIPTETDLNVNTKLAGSNLLWQILNNTDFKDLQKKLKPEQTIEVDSVKKIYNQLVQTKEYQHYILIGQQSKQEDKKIFEFMFDKMMLSNDTFLSIVEEQFTNWYDDGDMVVQIITGYISKPNSISLTPILQQDKEDFAFNLLKTALDKETHLMEIIKPKLKNWDPERIAVLDMIIMKLGVAELLYFETIPPKVTINEYIDLAKEYSTEQSGHFVNGILDNIHKELLQNNKLNKVEFKKY